VVGELVGFLPPAITGATLAAIAASGRWVWVTAGAWLIGVLIPVVALSAAPNGWPLWIHAGIGVVAAVAMGVTVGGLTGRTLERLLDS